jgi:hypothetical protein
VSHFVQFVARTEHYLHKGSQLAHNPALITRGGGHDEMQVLFSNKAASALHETQLSVVPEHVAHTLEHGVHYLVVELAIVIPPGHVPLQVPLYIKKSTAQVRHAVLLVQSLHGDSQRTHVFRAFG